MEESLTQTPEKTAPVKKVRSEKQIAWSRQLGQKSGEMKAAKKAKQAEQEIKQESNQERIIPSPNPKPTSSQFLILSLIGGLTLLAYFMYKKRPESEQKKEPPITKKNSTETKQTLVFMQ